MTAVAQPALPKRRPDPTPEARPKLRVVRPGEVSAARRRRRARLRAATVVLLVVTGMFLLVASHVLLTQGQFRLQTLQRQADDQQARYERLRLEVARLESPERIVAVAQQRLGMVPPPGVKYLSPTGAATRSAPAAGRQLASPPSASDWSAVKRRLASQP